METGEIGVTALATARHQINRSRCHSASHWLAAIASATLSASSVFICGSNPPAPRPLCDLCGSNQLAQPERRRNQRVGRGQLRVGGQGAIDQLPGEELHLTQLHQHRHGIVDHRAARVG